MDTDRFIIHIKTKDFYEDVADDVEKKKMIHQIMTLIDHFQQKRIIRLMKDKPGGKIMTKFAPLRPKKCEYLEKYK